MEGHQPQRGGRRGAGGDTTQRHGASDWNWGWDWALSSKPAVPMGRGGGRVLLSPHSSWLGVPYCTVVLPQASVPHHDHHDQHRGGDGTHVPPQ